MTIHQYRGYNQIVCINGQWHIGPGTSAGGIFPTLEAVKRYIDGAYASIPLPDAPMRVVGHGRRRVA